MVIKEIKPSISSIPNGYLEWREKIALLIEQSKLKAIMNVNTEMLTLYWKIGNDILTKQREEGWGTNVVDKLSKDLSKRFRNDKGYSTRNLNYMKAFAEAYPDFPILQVGLAKLEKLPINQQVIGELAKNGEFVQVPLAQISWYHHISLLAKVKGEHVLMYHTKLHCYVVVELKAVEFVPEFVGKLNFYISAVDEYVKTPEDNPTIGLLLCRAKSDKKAAFSLRGITQPMGIAQYEIEQLFRDMASALPQIEDLEEKMM